MESDRFSDDARRVKHSFKILDDDEYGGDDERMGPIAPLERRDQDRRDPADHNSDVRNHGQNNDQETDERREVETKKSEDTSDQRPVDEADQQLAAKIGNDIIINLRQGSGDLVFQWRSAQRQIIFPPLFDSR